MLCIITSSSLFPPGGAGERRTILLRPTLYKHWQPLWRTVSQRLYSPSGRIIYIHTYIYIYTAHLCAYFVCVCLSLYCCIASYILHVFYLYIAYKNNIVWLGFSAARGVFVSSIDVVFEEARYSYDIYIVYIYIYGAATDVRVFLFFSFASFNMQCESLHFADELYYYTRVRARKELLFSV